MHVHNYDCVCVRMCVCAHEGLLTVSRRSRTFYRRPPRIHFRGKTKFRWVVGIGRVLSYFIIHEGTFLLVVAAADSLARSSVRHAVGWSFRIFLECGTPLDRFLSRPRDAKFRDRHRFSTGHFFDLSLSRRFTSRLHNVLVVATN